MEGVLSLSYGKDSLACIGACEELGWTIKSAIHAEVWATPTIPADPPPMVEFKKRADAIIKERWGITVEHVRAKLSYEEIFYRKKKRGPSAGEIYGWPFLVGPWCNGHLKVSCLNKVQKGTTCFIGIAIDEPNRFKTLSPVKVSPLVEAGWDEGDCRKWCEENDLLSPIYNTETRGGCWFCHNQGVNQLRRLRKTYPEYWAKMLEWDADSWCSFKADGRSVHDYDRRFQLEDEGLIFPDDKAFRWSLLDEELNTRLF